MKTIYKYELLPDDKNPFEIKMPKGAEILTVQSQNGNAQIWAVVNTDSEMESRFFETFGTGHEMPDDRGVDRKYIGTFQLPPLVFHVFERL